MITAFPVAYLNSHAIRAPPAYENACLNSGCAIFKQLIAVTTFSLSECTRTTGEVLGTTSDPNFVCGVSGCYSIATSLACENGDVYIVFLSTRSKVRIISGPAANRRGEITCITVLQVDRG